ncbi:MAG: hypothetical protein ACC655_02105 [Rhodothermia bacterium]
MKQLVACILLTGAGLIAFPASSNAQADSLRLEGAGLVSYNRIVTHLGDIPVTVAYIRGDFRVEGRPYLWPNLEPAPGEYNFAPFIDALDEAERKGIKLGFRIITAHPWTPRKHPVYPFFPEWIPFKKKIRGDRTAYAPDWEHPETKESLRNLLVALGDSVRNHPALLFVDIGVLGWVGEWHTTVGFYNEDFMPSLETMLEYVDFHIEAFGADKLLLNLGAMKPEVLAYGLSKGINGIRQDCFGSTYHMDQYENKLNQVPALANVIESGIVFFEVCGGNMSQWTHQPDDPNGVTLPIDEIIDRAIRWKTTLFGNMGAPIPDRYLSEYLRLQRAMAGYTKTSNVGGRTSEVGNE